MNKNDFEEIGERVIAAIYEENVGNPFKRQHIVAGRAFDAKLLAAEKPIEICKFVNKYGFCKLEVNHAGTHTVISLGFDD